MAFMTKQTLLDICKEHKLYRTPSLNDKLYLNFKGFVKIECLEEYKGLRALFLEGNALDTIEGMPELPELRCLYLQQNCLWKVSHLEGLPELDSINLSQNLIKKLEGLSCCPKLATLLCTDNQLEGLDSIEHLVECKNLTTVDLQNNRISDPAFLDIMKQLPNLKCLYMKGNPVVSCMKNYRKVVIAALPGLGYLDERPIFEDERRMVNAWSTGGLEAERRERTLIREEKEEYDRRNFEAMQAIRREGWAKRRERLGLPPGDTDPALDELSDEEWVIAEDPPELVEARKRLAAYQAQQTEEEKPLPGMSDADIYYGSVRSSQAELNGAANATPSAAGEHAAAQQPMAEGKDASDQSHGAKDQSCGHGDGARLGTQPLKQHAVGVTEDDSRPASDTIKAMRGPVVEASAEALDLNELD